MLKKPKRTMNLDDVRALVKEVREEGLRIQRHYKRLEEEYSDWEDRVWKLDQMLSKLEDETGLTKEEIQREDDYLPDDLIMTTPTKDDSDNITGDDDWIT